MKKYLLLLATLTCAASAQNTIVIAPQTNAVVSIPPVRLNAQQIAAMQTALANSGVTFSPGTKVTEIHVRFMGLGTNQTAVVTFR